jgi:membrane-associated protein
VLQRASPGPDFGQVAGRRGLCHADPMQAILAVIDFIRHIDAHLITLTQDYGVWVYGILFAIVFCETGLVVTPFLPGDSLLFAVGAIAARDGAGIEAAVAIPLLIIAAILGDAVNFGVGHLVGPGFLEKGKLRFIKPLHLKKTQAFYDRYGGKTIVLARFVPIVRTFAPFVAGIGRMAYPRFALFNVVGAVAWVVICLGAGLLFGDLPFVKKNFELVVLGIIGVSVLPMVVEVLRARAAPPEATR